MFAEGARRGADAKPVNELEVGDRIAIARASRCPSATALVSMIEVWRWPENDPLELTWKHLDSARALGAAVRPVREAGRRAPQPGPNWRNGSWTKIIRMRQSDRLTLPCFWRSGIDMPEGAKIRRRIAGRSVAMPAHIEITDDVLWLLGLWVAEGSSHERANKRS